MIGDPGEEGQVVAPWGAVVVAAEEVANDLEEPGDPSPAEKQGRQVVCNRTEVQHCRLNVLIPLIARLTLDTHLSVHHRNH